MTDITALKEHVYDIIGALYEVHKELGAGLNEYCYQEALQIQLEEQEIPFCRELTFHPTYHGKEMEATYR
ncbi:MAG: GxxExxY protein, partial [Muribaculaceae bacterium]|nr:GxxExxY protein [Muribaculaceae bacterium]